MSQLPSGFTPRIDLFRRRKPAQHLKVETGGMSPPVLHEGLDPIGSAGG